MDGLPILAHIIIVISVQISIGAGQETGDPVECQSQAGDQIRLHVVQYTRSWLAKRSTRAAEPPREPVVEVDVFVLVTIGEIKDTKDGRIAQIELACEGEPPCDAGQWQYRVFLNLDTLAVKSVKSISPLDIAPHGAVFKYDQFEALFSGAYGFPVDWVVDLRDLSDDFERGTTVSTFDRFGRGLSRTVSVQDEKETRQVDVAQVHERGNRRGPRIVQEWRRGQWWWDSFKRFDGEYLDLEAVRAPKHEEEVSPVSADRSKP